MLKSRGVVYTAQPQPWDQFDEEFERALTDHDRGSTGA